MGNRSPSRIRREGRNAHAEGSLKEDCPYANKPYTPYDSWMEGWEDAEKDAVHSFEEEKEAEELCAFIMAEIESFDSESNLHGLVMLLIDKGIITY